MNKRERVYAALEGEAVDQVPLSLWRHFHKQDQTPTGLASATLAFYQRYNLDLIKLTPNVYYAVKDWGVSVATPRDDNTPPHVKKTVIKKPEDWRSLSTLSARDGAYGDMLRSLELVTEQLGETDAPVLMPIYSPLTLAYQMAGKALLDHLNNHPTDVHIGLATIAETTSRFADSALAAGADGIFFTSELSHAGVLTEDLCQAFVVRYDLIALERVGTQPVPLILCLQGANIFFTTANQYPAHAISWDTNQGNPSLSEALALTNKTLITGLDETQLEQSNPATIQEAAQAIIQQTGGKRLILAPTSVISVTTPHENLDVLTDMNREPKS